MFDLNNKNLNIIYQQLALLNDILEMVNTGQDYNLTMEKLNEWKKLTNYQVINNISPKMDEELVKLNKVRFTAGTSIQNLRDEINMYRDFLLDLAHQVK